MSSISRRQVLTGIAASAAVVAAPLPVPQAIDIIFNVTIAPSPDFEAAEFFRWLWNDPRYRAQIERFMLTDRAGQQ